MLLEIEKTHYTSCLKAREKLFKRVLDGDRPNPEYEGVTYIVDTTMATCPRCSEFLKTMHIMQHNAALKKKKASIT